MNADDLDRPGQVIANRYKLERLLGVGGMARVWLAVHLELGNRVAVKILGRRHDPEALARILFEAKTAARLHHPNIVTAFDFVRQENGQACIIMEYVEGVDLERALEAHGRFSWEELGPVALQICKALAYAHESGIIHRDVKPSNCLVTDFGSPRSRVKLIDFGIARDPHIRQGFNTESGLFFGTPEYMAPERDGDQPASIASDIYGLGVTLYKLVTGVVPFSGKDAVETLSQHRHAELIPPNERIPGLGLPAAAEALIVRALQKEPGKRFASVEKMAAAIEQSLWVPLEERRTHVALDSDLANLRSTQVRPSVADGKIPEVEPPRHHGATAFGSTVTPERGEPAVGESVDASEVGLLPQHAAAAPETVSGQVSQQVDATHFPRISPALPGITEELAQSGEDPSVPTKLHRAAPGIRVAVLVGLAALFHLVSGWIAADAPDVVLHRQPSAEAGGAP